MLVGVGVAAVAVLAAVVVAVLRPWERPPAPAPSVPTVAAQPSVDGNGFVVGTATASPSPPPSAPEDELAATVQTDRGRVEQVVGYWVPQVSSKAPGTVANGHAYTGADVVADHASWVQRYPEAALLRSGDYTSFSSSGFWVTIVARPFTTPAQANAWCDAQRLSGQDCYAKRLSHTDGPTGNAVHRP